MLKGEMTRKEFEQRLIERSKSDSDFRQTLLTEPKKAIEMEFGETIPDNIAIEVHENTDRVRHFVLPWNPLVSESEELSDDELEYVAGGVFDCTGVVLATVLCTSH